jgi:Fe-S oxidoreductase
LLPFDQRIAFAIFALLTLALGVRGFYRLYLRVNQGRRDTESRANHLARRAWYALRTTLTQDRVFRKRPFVSLFHSFIFYAFVLYLLVNFVDAIEGYIPLQLFTHGVGGVIYGFLSDAFSVLAILGVVALVFRRFLLPSRRDFTFSSRTLVHPSVQRGTIQRDSLIVSVFILFHVGSRIVGNAARLALTGPHLTGPHLTGPDRAQPFSTFLSHAFVGHHAMAWRIFGYWGALGSVLLFLIYFPYSKHVHLLMAPLKYLFSRDAPSGELPAINLNLESPELDSQPLDSPEQQAPAQEAIDPALGAAYLADLSWPRLLDAYACIQCNRCQDVCPASQTGKALSPAALEINKRMALNTIAHEINPFALSGTAAFERGQSSGANLLQAIISPESVWACTTCGACMEVCPTQNEQMLDIVDIRRNLVMQQGEFPAQLQTAFRGMERAKNPWGIARDKRMDWAKNLNLPTIDEVPDPDVLYWVGCAASYDPGAQKTARAVVQLLAEAHVNFAVLGNRESCTGDSARRAGNEPLFQELATANIATLNQVRPRLVLASCPHCVNTLATEYPQLGGNYNVMHHTEYLDTLLQQRKLTPEPTDATITFHDPCYLGRHRGSYDQPRAILNILSNDFVELDRTRSNSFCCGAGGAQFWKEEEPGDQRISENRFHEVQRTLDSAPGNTTTREKVLAVGCPFCKSMLQSTPSAAEGPVIAIKDIAELLLEGVQRARHLPPPTEPFHPPSAVDEPAFAAPPITPASQLPVEVIASVPAEPPALALLPRTERKKWSPKPTPPKTSTAAPAPDPIPSPPTIETTDPVPDPPSPPARKKWKPDHPR